MEAKDRPPFSGRTPSTGRSRKRKALRAAFVVTTALGASACSPLTSQCPEERPSSGGSCDEAMACTYEDECQLEVTANCEPQGTWSLESAGTCNPPPPAECPADLPEWGAACDPELGDCSYNDANQCGDTIIAMCNDGTW